MTHLLIIVFGQHRLQNLGQADGCVVNYNTKDSKFFGHYDELHHADVSLFINKNAPSQFGLVQPSEGARHIRNSVRKLSDQAFVPQITKRYFQCLCWCNAFCHELT